MRVLGGVQDHLAVGPGAELDLRGVRHGRDDLDNGCDSGQITDYAVRRVSEFVYSCQMSYHFGR